MQQHGSWNPAGKRFALRPTAKYKRPASILFDIGDDMDYRWIIWQTVVPLTAPFLVWFIAIATRSGLRDTPKFTAHLGTWKRVIEEYGWLMYAVFLSLQSGVAIHDAKSSPSWIFIVNIIVLLSSLLLLGVAFFARFVDSGGNVAMKASTDVQIERPAAGLVALAAAVIGYFTISSGKVL